MNTPLLPDTLWNLIQRLLPSLPPGLIADATRGLHRAVDWYQYLWPITCEPLTSFRGAGRIFAVPPSFSCAL